MQTKLGLPETEWPRLSKTLRGPVAPDYCQSCARHVNDCAKDLRRWIEHNQFPKDSWDRDNPTVLVLCDACSEKIIEPHPRLYTDMKQHWPNPGSMVMCIDCRHRVGLTCLQSKAGGGPGLELKFAKPYPVNFDGTTKGGRRTGWTEVVYPRPVESCSKELLRSTQEEIPVYNRDGQRVLDPGYSTEPDEEDEAEFLQLVRS